MKRFIIIISIFISLNPAVKVNAQENEQWDILNDGGSFRAIDFINDDTGWIAGNGILLKTIDAGETWNKIPLGVESEWDRVELDFIDDSLGWLADHRSLFKTQDGGHSWAAVTMPKIDAELVFCCVNDSVIYVEGCTEDEDAPKILRSIDQGESWIDISFPTHVNVKYQSLRFLSSNVGVILGKHWIEDEDETDYAVILNTIDGGTNWYETILPDFSKEEKVYDLQFVDDSTAYFFAQKHNESGDTCFLYKSSDSGNSWSIKAQTSNPIHTSYFLNNAVGFAIMDNNVMQTIDGGLTWEKIDEIWVRASRGCELHFSSDNVGFILNGSAIYRSTDGGQNWILNKIKYPFHDIFFLDKMNGFMCGGSQSRSKHGGSGDGTLFSTSDGGKTWKSKLQKGGRGGRHIQKSCYFISDSLGFVCSGRGIYRTTNGGNTWTCVDNNNHNSKGFSFNSNDLFFKNEAVGWSAGWGRWSDNDSSGGGVISTIDGGDNWELVWKYHTNVYGYDLNSIHVVNKTAWAVGDGGMMVKYTDQDQWQLQTSITDLPLNQVFFSDEQHGWIVGGYFNDEGFQSILLKTNDAGQTWNEKRFDKYILNDMYFTDSLHGWAAGEDTSYSGMILETTDGGENWIAQLEDLSAPLNGIHFKDGYGWAVGGNGLVLRTEDGSTWIDEKNNKVYPSKFELSQNYPNPFNPKTVISYQLPVISEVELSIYNILGQKVATLVSEKQPAGVYKIEWDAADFASGVYYYLIQANDFQQVKKMIILK